jgi:hypothetical protein
VSPPPNTHTHTHLPPQRTCKVALRRLGGGGARAKAHAHVPGGAAPTGVGAHVPRPTRTCQVVLRRLGGGARAKAHAHVPCCTPRHPPARPLTAGGGAELDSFLRAHLLGDAALAARTRRHDAAYWVSACGREGRGGEGLWVGRRLLRMWGRGGSCELRGTDSRGSKVWPRPYAIPCCNESSHPRTPTHHHCPHPDASQALLSRLVLKRLLLLVLLLDTTLGGGTAGPEGSRAGEGEEGHTRPLPAPPAGAPLLFLPAASAKSSAEVSSARRTAARFVYAPQIEAGHGDFCSSATTCTEARLAPPSSHPHTRTAAAASTAGPAGCAARPPGIRARPAEGSWPAGLPPGIQPEQEVGAMLWAVCGRASPHPS